jgi:glutathione gamma-glutamylcysteinyltransferase
MVSPSFYRRPLPDGLIGFSTAEGRALFREALEAGTLEGFFPLAEQFHTQAEPAYCGLGSLVVALNALGIDPGRLWKGPWRWFGEELLDCCVPLEVVRERGLTLDQLACLAQCNGAAARTRRASSSSVEALREEVLGASGAAGGRVVIASYDRAVLGQTGQGHFSPIGGYHAPRDLALVLDVARFKYPPVWVPLARLHQAMQTTDVVTGAPRGWIELTADQRPRPLFVRLVLPDSAWPSTMEAIRARVLGGASADALVSDLLSPSSELRGLVFSLAAGLGNGQLAPEHRARAESLLPALRATRAFAAASRASGLSDAPPLAAEIAAVMALAFGRSTESLEGDLEEEVSALKRQLEVLCAAPV